MPDGDKYRCFAEECMRLADKSKHLEDQQGFWRWHTGVQGTSVSDDLVHEIEESDTAGAMVVLFCKERSSL
jgi:hypothetical protein